MATNFYLDKRTDKSGDAPIRISVVIMGVRYLSSTGLKIAPSKWDSDKQQARRGVSNAKGVTWATINSTLARMTDFFAKFENECITTNSAPAAEVLKAEFAKEFGRRRPTQEVKRTDFWDYYQMFIDERSVINQWTQATRYKFGALRTHIQEWKMNISFEDFTEAGLNRFITYLREKRNMKNTTIGKQLGFLKWFLRWAASKGYNTNLDFQVFLPKLRTTKNQVVFLDWDELMTVFNYPVPENGTTVTLRDWSGKEYTKEIHDAAAIAKTRDIFCFCCFTSLRYSDANNLRRSNIEGDAITLTTVKTADTITIELNKYARAILDRYANAEFKGDYALPRITNQRMNVYLKELCELCGINQPITRTYYQGAKRVDRTSPKYELVGTHTGRRTFICNALMLGIPAEIVMKWTGHADYKSMKPYIDVTNQAKARAMSRFDEL